MAIHLGGIEFHAGPPVLNLIAVQELGSRPVAAAVIAAKTAGVRVQVILEAC